jgi:hypothetical protein
VHPTFRCRPIRRTFADGEWSLTPLRTAPANARDKNGSDAGFYQCLVRNELDLIMRTKDNVLKEFEFVDSGRKFFCSVEKPKQAGMQPWWWFRLETGESTRYAPFEASEKDTKQSVQARIIAYYEQLLSIESRPAYQRPAWKKPERPAQPADAVPATPLGPTTSV